MKKLALVLALGIVIWSICAMPICAGLGATTRNPDGTIHDVRPTPDDRHVETVWTRSSNDIGLELLVERQAFYEGHLDKIIIVNHSNHAYDLSGWTIAIATGYENAQSPLVYRFGIGWWPELTISPYERVEFIVRGGDMTKCAYRYFVVMFPALLHTGYVRLTPPLEMRDVVGVAETSWQTAWDGTIWTLD